MIFDEVEELKLIRETVTYEADGLAMRSELFFMPAIGPRPGVLVYPEVYGLNEHALERAERLATLGYVALACDLHGDARVVDDLGAAIAMIDRLNEDPSKTRARALGGLIALAAHPEVDASRIGAIGFCFGGSMCLELARSGAAIKAVVGFYNSLTTIAPKSDSKAIKARVLVCLGADDPFSPPAERARFEAEMRGTQVDWQMNIYGNTVHGFANPAAAKANKPDLLRYSAEADRRSWKAMKEVLAEALI